MLIDHRTSAVTRREKLAFGAFAVGYVGLAIALGYIVVHFVVKYW